VEKLAKSSFFSRRLASERRDNENEESEKLSTFFVF